jgi:NAD+ kinase
MKPSSKNAKKTVSFFYRSDNVDAAIWARKIDNWIKTKHPELKIVPEHPHILIVLGGDGTILEAAKKYHKSSTIIIGLNMGHVGFLASVREPKNFLPALDTFFTGKFSVAKRMMLDATVVRRGKAVFTVNSLNDVVVQNILGMVEIRVEIEEHPVQYIRGTGILVGTATGSTAFNLSAHGPIVMPDIKCLIITELLDHNIPTPSIVVKRNRKIHLKILSFRKRGLLSISKTGEKADVVLVSDGETLFPLEEKDEIIIRRSSHLVNFAELEKNYFFKSLQEKFAFK